MKILFLCALATAGALMAFAAGGQHIIPEGEIEAGAEIIATSMVYNHLREILAWVGGAIAATATAAWVYVRHHEKVVADRVRRQTEHDARLNRIDSDLQRGASRFEKLEESLAEVKETCRTLLADSGKRNSMAREILERLKELNPNYAKRKSDKNGDGN